MARGGWRYVKAPPKTKMGEIGYWSQQKKDEVLTTWLATKSPTLTSQQCNIPIQTIETWKRQDWWKDRVAEIQTQDYEKLDSKLSNVIDKALDAVMDRLEGGEYQYDIITKKIKRVPAKLRDVNTTLNQIIDKRQLIRKMPTKIVEQQSTANQLKKLAEQFTQFVSGKVAVESFNNLVDQTIDGETVIQNEDGTYVVKET